MRAVYNTLDSNERAAVEIDPKKILRNKKVIAEINRHKWLESEIAGYDIGFEKAASDWLKRYAAAWIIYHHGKKIDKIAPFKKKSAKPR